MWLVKYSCVVGIHCSETGGNTTGDAGKASSN